MPVTIEMIQYALGWASGGANADSEVYEMCDKLGRNEKFCRELIEGIKLALDYYANKEQGNGTL